MQRAAWRNENKKKEDGGRKQERTLGLVAACTHFESACESDSGPASDVERTKAIAKHSQILTPTLLFAHLVSTFFSTGRCQQSSAGRAGSSPAGKRPESWLPKYHVSEVMVWPARPSVLARSVKFSSAEWAKATLLPSYPHLFRDHLPCRSQYCYQPRAESVH
jgi:hypothetical protein